MDCRFLLAHSLHSVHTLIMMKDHNSNGGNGMSKINVFTWKDYSGNLFQITIGEHVSAVLLPSGQSYCLSYFTILRGTERNTVVRARNLERVLRRAHRNSNGNTKAVHDALLNATGLNWMEV
jgi:hypothetical protein